MFLRRRSAGNVGAVAVVPSSSTSNHRTRSNHSNLSNGTSPHPSVQKAGPSSIHKMHLSGSHRRHRQAAQSAEAPPSGRRHINHNNNNSNSSSNNNNNINSNSNNSSATTYRKHSGVGGSSPRSMTASVRRQKQQQHQQQEQQRQQQQQQQQQPESPKATEDMQRMHSAKVGVIKENMPPSANNSNNNNHNNRNNREQSEEVNGSENQPLLTIGTLDESDSLNPTMTNVISTTNNDHQLNNEPYSACRLNIGGKTFRIRLKAVKRRFKNTSAFLYTFVMAGHPERAKQCDEYWSQSDEYYFERSPRLFEPVFDWLTSGTLHKPVDVCPDQFLDELKFWQVSKSHIAYCCVPQCSSTRSSIMSQSVVGNGRKFTYDNNPIDSLMMDGEKEIAEDENLEDEFSHVCCGSMRASLWDLTEDPSTSKAAKVFAVCSIGFVLLSVLGLILGSMPDLQVKGHTFTSDDGERKTEMIPHPVLQRLSQDFQGVIIPYLLLYMEYCCIGWFTMEYILRFSICTHKWSFFKETLNLIDFITIAPFYLELGMGAFGFDVDKLSNIKGAVLVMRIVRVLRVARVFKLARYSTGLKSFGTTVQNSVQELSMLFLFLITAIIFFSTIVYFLEKDEKGTNFHSIPDAMWWCIVTMTTVGYGDSVPITALGKVVASFASISGVLVLAFPITMIVENFSKSYDKAQNEPEPPKSRKNRRRSTAANSAMDVSRHSISVPQINGPNHV